MESVQCVSSTAGIAIVSTVSSVGTRRLVLATGRAPNAGHSVAKVRWCKSKCEGTDCDGGSPYNRVKRIYALDVARELAYANTGVRSETCHCGAPIDLWSGEVDRTVEGCYTPGYVVMTCTPCNNDRTHMPQHSEQYVADVLHASRAVIIVGPTEAKNIYEKGRGFGSTFRNSPYFDRG